MTPRAYPIPIAITDDLRTYDGDRRGALVVPVAIVVALRSAPREADQVPGRRQHVGHRVVVVVDDLGDHGVAVAGLGLDVGAAAAGVVRRAVEPDVVDADVERDPPRR